MRSSVHRHHAGSGLMISPLIWVAAASFIAGFGGYLLFGLNNLR